LKLRNTPKATIDEKVKKAAKILMIEHLLERSRRRCPVVNVSA